MQFSAGTRPRSASFIFLGAVSVCYTCLRRAFVTLHWCNWEHFLKKKPLLCVCVCVQLLKCVLSNRANNVRTVFFLPTLHRRRRRYCVSLHFGNLEDGHFSLFPCRHKLPRNICLLLSHSFAAIWWLAFAGSRRDRSGAALLFASVLYTTVRHLFF